MADKREHINPTWLAKYQFKPGQSGNPKGKPARPKELRDFLIKSEADTLQFIAELLKKTKAELQTLLEEGDNLTLEQSMLIRCFQRVILAGDYGTIEAVYMRIYGKPGNHKSQEIDDDESESPLNVREVLKNDESARAALELLSKVGLK